MEHIFNYPQALINTSKMLKNGGKIIHDLPCDWVEHGFYNISPTCLIDYYTANRFYIDDIYLMGYQYPNFEMVNVISPDCRYNDSNKWIDTFARGYHVLLVCEATKEHVSTEENISFVQYSYAVLNETLNRNKSLYSYEYRVEKTKQIIKDNPQCRIAIYGTGITANKMMNDLQDSLDNIVGVYDGKIKSGKVVEFDICERNALNINDVHRDKIQYIVLASEKIDVIDILRQRLKHLRSEGIEII